MEISFIREYVMGFICISEEHYNLYSVLWISVRKWREIQIESLKNGCSFNLEDFQQTRQFVINFNELWMEVQVSEEHYKTYIVLLRLIFRAEMARNSNWIVEKWLLI